MSLSQRHRTLSVTTPLGEDILRPLVLVAHPHQRLPHLPGLDIAKNNPELSGVV